MTIVLDATARNASHAFELIRVRLAPLFELFEEEGVTSVNYNGTGETFKTVRGERRPVEAMISEITAASAVRELASAMGQEAEASTPTGIVDAKMPGFRFCAILSPVATKGTSFSIRKHHPQVLSLADYVEKQTLTPAQAELLSRKVKEGANILIGGGTDSGKTTFLNALSREIPPTERVATIEDTRELQLIVPDWLPIATNAQRGVTPTLCVKALMRNEPDRIICGELRDEVAADFIEATYTGHHGCMATVHCNSAALALERMETLCIKASAKWPLFAIQRNIGGAIHVIAHFKKVGGVRRLSELCEVNGFDSKEGKYNISSLL